jgi:DNA-binding MarR family transcriptional regulator
MPEMFMPDKNLGMPEYAVSRAIEELSEEHVYINASLIADHIGCVPKTVYRAMKRLEKANKLTRLEGSPSHGGYRYVVEH